MSSGSEFTMLRLALSQLVDASERLLALHAVPDAALADEDDGAADLAALEGYRAAVERARLLTR
jgi:hypothetical protein